MLKQILQVAQEIESVFERSQALTHVVQAYARFGQFDSALTIIETIEDPYKKVDALARLAEAYSKAGVQDKAFEMLEQAVQVTPEPGMSTMEIRQISLCLIAKTYVAIGEYSQAIQVVQNYSYIRDEPYPLIRYDLFLDPSKRSELLELAQARNVQQITRILQVGDDEITCEHQVVALAEVAGECANGEQFEFAMQALRVADSIEFGKESRAKAFKLNALSKIAVKYAEIGQFDLAIQVVEKIDAIGWRASPLKNIACKLAKAGQYDRAFKLIETIERANEKNEALEELAKQYAETGHYDKALQITKSIKMIDYQDSAFLKIVQNYIKSGHYKQAFQIAKRKRRNDFKLDLLIAIAEASAQVKKASQVLSQALRETKTIKSPGGKVFALTDIAIKYAAFRQETKSLALLAQAIEIVESDEAS
ncbi:MAG TPA: hypothetical protein VK211_22715, partial [Kamptonema sp.]|nr:hypothetical protein [Kamptonema sp.]